MLEHGRLPVHKQMRRAGNPTASTNGIAYMRHILPVSQGVSTWRLRNAGMLCSDSYRAMTVSIVDLNQGWFLVVQYSWDFAWSVLSVADEWKICYESVQVCASSLHAPETAGV